MYNHHYNPQNRHNFHSLGDKPSKPDPDLFDVTFIHKNLFIGDKNISLNKSELKRLQIKHIVAVGQQLETKFQNQFNYLKISIKDSSKVNILQVLERTNVFIDECVGKKENVLIHCAFGVSRSASVLIGFMIFKFKMSFEEAHHFVKQRRPTIKPNEGFREQLKKYSMLRNKK